MQINAIVLSVLYPKERTEGEHNWYVLSTTCGRVVGSSRLNITPGRTYIFNGEPSVYQGQSNFKFSSIREEIPEDPLALLRYACAVTNGLGPAFATQMWDKYGSSYRNAVTLSPKGKKEEALAKTLEVLSNNVEESNALSYMMSIGATQNLAELAYARFGASLVSLVREDPYILAELPQQSFKTIDAKFREAFNIGINSKKRVRSLISYHINNSAETSGDTCFNVDEIVKSATLEYGVEEAIIRDVISFATAYVDEGIVSTNTLLKHEKCIHDYATNNREELDVPHIYETDVSLDDSQREACEFALSHNGIVCINGGAGCGKTTIISSLAVTLAQNEEIFRICAFAGKAAARVREATKFDATTIHSMLEYLPDIGFRCENLNGETIIIDEASMVPASLLYEICKRQPKRIILVGDEGQLPPVGAGAPFHDFVRCGQTYTRTVTTCYRNKEAIFQAAYAVRNGQAPKTARSDNETFTIVQCNNKEKCQSYVDGILKHLDFNQDIIITPRNGESDTDASVRSFNHSAMTHLGFDAPGTVQEDCRIICLKNEPKLDVWNGTIAKVDKIDIDGNAYIITDEGKQTKLPRKYLKDSTAPAYALTIHKAQGSQYRRVVVVALHCDTIALLNNEMLYTAITRAKNGCVVVTDTNLLNIIRKHAHRNTILSRLLGYDQ